MKRCSAATAVLLGVLFTGATIVSCQSGKVGGRVRPANPTVRPALGYDGSAKVVVGRVQRLQASTGQSGESASASAGPIIAKGPLVAEWARGVLRQERGGTNISAIASDSVGNIYAVGSVVGTVDLVEGVRLRAVGDKTAPLIVKYDASGRVLWANTISRSDGHCYFNSVAVDSLGNAYAAGMMSLGYFAFGDKAIVEGKFPGSNLLLVKYDPTGQVQWARTLADSSGESEFKSVAVDGAGLIYTAGYYWPSDSAHIAFSHRAKGYATIPSDGERSGGLLAQYDSSGQVRWAAQVAGVGITTNFNSVTPGKTGEVYVGGYVDGSSAAEFGNGVVTYGSGKMAGVLVKYDTSGTARWARSVESADQECRFQTLGMDSQGNIYATGVVEGTGKVDFGNNVTVHGAIQKQNPLVVKYDPQGRSQWARSLQRGSGKSYFHHTAAVDGNYLYLAGSFVVEDAQGSFDFGNAVSTQTVNEPGSVEVLLAYGLSGNPEWALTPFVGSRRWGRRPDTMGIVDVHSIVPLKGGRLLFAGIMQVHGLLDLGNGVTLTGISPIFNLFLSEFRHAE